MKTLNAAIALLFSLAAIPACAGSADAPVAPASAACPVSAVASQPAVRRSSHLQRTIDEDDPCAGARGTPKPVRRLVRDGTPTVPSSAASAH